MRRVNGVRDDLVRPGNTYTRFQCFSCQDGGYEIVRDPATGLWEQDTDRPCRGRAHRSDNKRSES